MSLSEHIKGLRPQDGAFALVEIETGQPVGQAAHVLVEFDDADEVEIPPDTDFEKYALYDASGTIYTRESWPDPFSEAPDEGPDEKADAGSSLPDWMQRGNTNY